MRTLTNLVSRLVGKFAQKEFPASIQGLINSLYVRLLGVNLSEFKESYKYKSLNELFTRQKEAPLRLENANLVSPCDGKVVGVGEIKDAKSYQIKSISYDLNALLTNITQTSISKIANGYFLNIYLSPKDYHRYHAPCDLQIKRLIHVPAKLYPVNNLALRFVKDLYIQNERVIIEANTFDHKKVFIVLVGALNVGSMIVHFEPKLLTNTAKTETTSFLYENLSIQKGQEFGYFKMGSTILIFTQSEKFSAMQGEILKVGEAISKVV